MRLRGDCSQLVGLDVLTRALETGGLLPSYILRQPSLRSLKGPRLFCDAFPPETAPVSVITIWRLEKNEQNSKRVQ